MNQPEHKAEGSERHAPEPTDGATGAATDPPPELSMEEQLHALQDKLDAQASEAQKYQDLYTRERAELENFKRRMQREKGEALRYSIEPLVRDLLIAVDNLERAIDHAEGGDPALVEGVKLVYKSLLDVLERHAVQRIDATGGEFDPTQHQAIAQVDSADHEPNQVVVQHQAGFKLYDRLLRPAMVSVCGRKTGANVESAPERD